MPDSKEEMAQAANLFTRHENFESWYANNIQFHPSEWDLKLIFGELDWPPEKEGKMVVQQHTAMSLSWRQAKILRYFLDIQIAAQEMASGKISIPQNLFPPPPQPPAGELENDPTAHRVFEIVKKAREDFIAENSIK